MKKLLYVTVPFEDSPDHCQSRQSFIWSVLYRHFDADLLLVKTPEYLTRPVPTITGYEQQLSISSSHINPFKPRQIHQFSKENLDKFSRILESQHYDLLFFQSESMFELAWLAEKILPEGIFILDFDTLLSKHEQILWEQNPVWKNKAHQLDYLSLRRLEKQLLNLPWLFIFTGQTHRKSAWRLAGLDKDDPHFLLLPNPIPETPQPLPKQKKIETDKPQKAEMFILFYGDLSTVANLDAFEYLVKEIYPRISKKMQEKDIKVFIAGPNALPLHTQLTGGRVKLIDAAEPLQDYLKACLLVILPLRKKDPDASQRIVEAAKWKKAVLTTDCALADIELGPAEIASENTVEAYCERLLQLIAKPDARLDLGQHLFDKINLDYNHEHLEQQLFNRLNSMSGNLTTKPLSAPKCLVIVSDAFGREAGKIASHVWYLAYKLAETCKVTVFCPRQNGQPKLEIKGDLTIRRFFNLWVSIKLKSGYPLKPICPGLLVQLLKEPCDLIQCYPGFTPNCMAGFLAAKIREIPLAMTIFPPTELPVRKTDKTGFIRETTDGDVFNWRKRIILRFTDYIFTVTEKYYTLLRQLNDRVEQIPLPLNFQDYKDEPSSPRGSYDMDEQSFVFLVLGSMSYYQGQDIAVQAFNQALSALPGARLVLVGETADEPDFQNALEDLIAREALREDVILTGEIEHSEVLAWLHSADILVIPARQMEAGNLAITGWAAGIPVLQSDAVDPNLVTDGSNGYLFRSEDVTDLAQQMQAAYHNRARLKELAENGKALVISKYSFDYLSVRHLEAYKQLTL